MENNYWQDLFIRSASKLRTQGNESAAVVIESASFTLEPSIFPHDDGGFSLVVVHFHIDSELHQKIAPNQNRICRDILDMLSVLHTDRRIVRIISVKIDKKGR